MRPVLVDDTHRPALRFIWLLEHPALPCFQIGASTLVALLDSNDPLILLSFTRTLSYPGCCVGLANEASDCTQA